MTTLRYTREHEWLRSEDDGSVTLGITDYAQEQLGDIVYVELPEKDASFGAGENLVVIESVKAVGEIAAPIAGTVAAVNERLAEEPEVVNGEPLGAGWLLRFEPDGEVDDGAFLDEAAYAAYVETL